MTYFDARDELRKAVAERGEPAPASPEDSVQHRLMQDYQHSSEQIARVRTEIANREKMRALNARLDSGELDMTDPARRWWNGLAPGERHGDRELAELDGQLMRYFAEDESDPRALLALLDGMREGEPDTPRGNITGAEALAELGISIRHDWKAS
jgi:hypothetical protein